MKIRKAKLKDVNNLYSFIKKSKELDLSKDPKYFNKNFLEVLVKNHDIYFIIAEEDKRIIGLLGAALWKNEQISYLDMFLVDKSYRKKGIGKDLFVYYLNDMIDDNVNYVWGLVKYKDKNLQDIAEKFGMKKRHLCYLYDIELK